jgi:hypothetical protein
MSTRQLIARLNTHHRVRTATFGVATALVLVGAAGGVAAADPPALNRETCTTAAMNVQAWPGTMSNGDDEVQLVSDAYVSYVSHKAGCTPDLSTR